MQRYKMTIAYRGTRYYGWQSQLGVSGTYRGPLPTDGKGLPTVQEHVTRALAGVLNHPVLVRGSSRTDTGVHAKGQVTHFDTERTQIPVESMRSAVNAKLPADILIRSIEPVSPEFDAIGDTVSKRYQYAIWNAKDRPPFFADLCWHRWQPLNIPAMREAAAALEGEHDFASFAKTGHGRSSTVRTIYSCDVSFRSPKLVIGVEGNGFLWNMVRIIVGTLVKVALDVYTPDDVKRMLEAKDRKSGGPTAPPHGLYLQWIKMREPVQTDSPPSLSL